MTLVLKEIKNRVFTIAVILSILLLTSCDNSGINQIKDPGVTFDYEKFKTKKRAWENANIENYSYEYFSSGFTFEHIIVYLENGVYYSSDSLENSMLLEYEKSITDIYDYIEERYITENSQDNSASDFYLTKIEFKYDNVYQYPEYVKYDYYISENIAVDGNFGFSILNFKIN